MSSALGWAQDVVAPGGQATGPPQRSAGNGTKFIVQFTKATPRSARAQIAQQAGATVGQDLGIIDALAVTVPNQNTLNALMNNRSVRRVAPDHPLYEAAPKTPPQPTNLTATAVSTSQINLAWTQPNGNNEEGTRIQRCTGFDCTLFVQVASVGANVTSYNDTGLAPDTTYNYRVIAFITSGKPSERESSPSAPAFDTTDTTDPPPSNPPADPSNLSANAVSDSQIDLAWQDNSSDEDNFQIDRCLGPECSSFVLHQTVGADVTNFSDTLLPGSTTFGYQVRATRAGVSSNYTTPAEATTLAPPVTPPVDPSFLSAVAVSTSQIDLTWTDNANDEDEFRIERCQGTGCSGFSQIDTVAANVQAYNDLGLPALTTFRYRVLASNVGGQSGYSSEDEATTLDNPQPPISFGGTRQVIPVTVQRVGPPDDYSDGTGQGVAVLDSGCDFNHRDLACTGVIDYFGGSGQDDRGHGTHVIGLINAQNNNFDIVGVAPEATLYSYKTLGADGSGSESNFAAAISDIVTNQGQFAVPVGVINISAGRALAGGELMEDTPICEAAMVAREAGIVVVVSAGNERSLEISQMTPAGCAAVIPVAATVATDGISQCPPDIFNPNGYPTVPADVAADFTTDGPGVISAPGAERDDTIPGCSFFRYGTLSTTLGGAQGLNPDDPHDPPGATRKIPIPLPVGAQEARGTSFAAPLVSGIALRMKQVGIGGGTGDAAEVDAIRTEIMNTADRASADPNDPNAAPLRHPWADLDWPFFTQTFDGVKEGIAQAPSAP